MENNRKVICEFLTALFNGKLEGIEFDLNLNGDRNSAHDPVAYADEHPTARLYPTKGATLCHLLAVADTTDKNYFMDCILEPSAVLHNGNTMLLFWTLDVPVAATQPRLLALMDAFDMTLDEPVPLPGGEWVLLYADPDALYTLDQLSEAYIEVAAGSPPENLTKYADATIFNGYNELDCKILTHPCGLRSQGRCP